MITRRELAKLALAGFVGGPVAGRLLAGRPEGRPLRDILGEATLEAASLNSVVNGVHLGVQTYSFRDLPRPPAPPTPWTS